MVIYSFCGVWKVSRHLHRIGRWWDTVMWSFVGRLWDSSRCIPGWPKPKVWYYCVFYPWFRQILTCLLQIYPQLWHIFLLVILLRLHHPSCQNTCLALKYYALLWYFLHFVYLGDNGRGCEDFGCEVPEGSGRMGSGRLNSKSEWREGFDVVIHTEP